MNKIDETLVVGPSFALPFDGGIYFNTYCESNIRIRPPTNKPQSVVYIRSNDTYQPASVINIPMLNDNIYTLQCKDGSLV